MSSHGAEHVYIFAQYQRTGFGNLPGLLGLGGAIGIIPLGRVDLHNLYNGFEMILMVLGFGFQTEVTFDASRHEKEGTTDAYRL